MFEYILLSILIVLVLVLIVLVVKSNNKTNIVGSDSRDIINPIKDELDRSSKNINDATSSIKDKIGKDFTDLLLKMDKVMEELKDNLKENIKGEFKITGDTINSLKEKMAVIDNEKQNIENLANQINDLEKVLGNNKTTGNFGEGILDQILYAYFGEDDKLYQNQYTIPGAKKKDGSACKPDSVIFMPKELVCIDSKFPIHFYQQYLNCEDEKTKQEAFKSLANAVKTQIGEVKQYIIKGKTSDYACMFIPSDTLASLIYKQMPELVDSARKEHVIILCPATLNPFISSLKTVKIDYERNVHAKKLYDSLIGLYKDFNLFGTRWASINQRVDQLVVEIKGLNDASNRLTNKFKDINDMNIEDKENKE